MKPVQRLNKDSLSILEQYDQDADKAIFLMEIKLKDLERQSKDSQTPKKLLQSVTFPLQSVTSGEQPLLQNVTFDPAYWKKLEQTVDSCIEKAKRY